MKPSASRPPHRGDNWPANRCALSRRKIALSSGAPYKTACSSSPTVSIPLVDRMPNTLERFVVFSVHGDRENEPGEAAEATAALRSLSRPGSGKERVLARLVAGAPRRGGAFHGRADAGRDVEDDDHAADLARARAGSAAEFTWNVVSELPDGGAQLVATTRETVLAMQQQNPGIRTAPERFCRPAVRRLSVTRPARNAGRSGAAAQLVVTVVDDVSGAPIADATVTGFTDFGRESVSRQGPALPARRVCRARGLTPFSACMSCTSILDSGATWEETGRQRVNWRSACSGWILACQTRCGVSTRFRRAGAGQELECGLPWWIPASTLSIRT